MPAPSRRSLHLSLPTSDPRSQRIWDHLATLPADADCSAELRRLLARALDSDGAVAARLARMEAKLDDLLQHGGGGNGAAPDPDPATVQALATILDFSDV